MKTCTTCGKVQPLDSFHKQTKGGKGRAAHCRSCASRKAAEYRLKNQDKIKMARQAYRAANRDLLLAKSRSIPAEKRSEYHATARRKYQEDQRYREQLIAQNRELRRERKEQYNAAQREKRADNPEKRQEESRKHYRKYREIIRVKQSEYHGENRARRSASNAEWRRDNREWLTAYYKAHIARIRAKTALRRAARVQATPAWADLERIKEFYVTADFLNMVTGIWHHVDHVVPVKHDLVCGLHVHMNLQVITEEANLRKSNRFVIE